MRARSRRRVGRGLLIVDAAILGFAVYCVIQAYGAGWAEGYRTPDWPARMSARFFPLFMVRLFALAPLVAYAAIRLHTRTKPYVLLLIAVTVFCMSTVLGPFALTRGRGRGRTALVGKTDLHQLAGECIALAGARLEPPWTGEEGGYNLLCTDWVTHPPDLPPTLARWRPTYIDVSVDRVHVEMYGGFDHYGFEAERLTPAGPWVLTWYGDDSYPRGPLVTVRAPPPSSQPAAD